MKCDTEELFIYCAVFSKPNWCRLYNKTVDCKGNRFRCIKTNKPKRKFNRGK